MKTKNSDNSADDEFYKKVTSSLIAYLEQNINLAADIAFDTKKIEYNNKDRFDLLFNNALNILIEKKLIESYSLESLYIDDQDIIYLGVSVKIPALENGIVVAKFHVKEQGI